MNKKFALGLSLIAATAFFLSGCASDSKGSGSTTDSLPTPATPPPGAPAPATAATPAAAQTAPITEEIHNPTSAQPAAAAAVATEKYVVKAGDSLWKIARDRKTSVVKLKDLNHLTGDVIRAGDELVVPVAKQ